MKNPGDNAKTYLNENALAESAEKYGDGLFYSSLYRIRHKKIDVIFVQCPFL